MKKIMQINITCGRGSTGKLSQALYEASILEGYEARFAYSAYTPTLKEAFSIESKLQNYLRRGLNRYFGRKQKHSTPGTKRLIRYIKREKPDLIHLHNVQQNSVNYHLLFKFLKESGIPVVYTLHDCFAFTGGCFYFTEMNCNGYKTGCRDCPVPFELDDRTCSAEKAYKSKSERLGGNDNVHLVCVSRWLRDCAAASYMGKMKHPPVTIYNGINTAFFYPRESNVRKELGIPENHFVIFSAAYVWDARKNPRLFLELSKKLAEDITIVLVGQGLENINAPNIIRLNRTESQDELARLYSAADVFINASMEETFGLTTAEAMACGTPAIVFNSTACPEIVDEQTGIVAEHSADGLLQAVLQIREKGKEAYQDACVKRVKENFDETRMVKEYLALYGRILNGE